MHRAEYTSSNSLIATWTAMNVWKHCTGEDRLSALYEMERHNTFEAVCISCSETM
jgi:hypothetical protein